MKQNCRLNSKLQTLSDTFSHPHFSWNLSTPDNQKYETKFKLLINLESSVYTVGGAETSPENFITSLTSDQL